MNWAYWLTLAVLGLFLLDSEAYWSKVIKGTLSNKCKRTHLISIPSTAQLPCCIVYLTPVFLHQARRVTDFVDTLLAFRKGVLLLITTFCIIYVFLHALIFYQPVWTPKATFQTIENNFLYRASIFRQLIFFTFHQTYSTLQRWMGKC